MHSYCCFVVGPSSGALRLADHVATIFKEATFAEMMQLVAQTISLQCICYSFRHFQGSGFSGNVDINAHSLMHLILILSDSKSEIISTFNLVWDKLK